MLRTLNRVLFASILALALALTGPAIAAATACGGKTAAPDRATPANATTLVIPVEGMSCGSCAQSLRAALMEVDGVFTAAVDVTTHQATVTFDAAKVTPAQLAAAIEGAGYKAGAPTPKRA